MRTTLGLAAAWIISVTTAFLAGCIYGVMLAYGDRADFIRAAGSGDKDALAIVLFVGGYSAVAAAVIAFVSIVLLAWPLSLLLRNLKSVSRWSYVIVGFAIAMVVAVVLVVAEINFNPLATSGDYFFEVMSILVVVPLAMLAMWAIVRPDRNSTNSNLE